MSRDASPVEIMWLGQAGFRLRPLDGGPSTFVDPFLDPHPDRTWPSPITPAELAASADVVLCSHEHIDHFDRPSLSAASAQPDARFTLVVPRPMFDDALGLGLPPSRVLGAQPGDVLDLAASQVQVHVVPARHGVHVSDAYTLGEELSGGLVRYLGYVVELGGTRIYHAGDCIPYEGQVERLRALAPDVVLLPINGRDYFRETERDIVGNMDPREAAHLAADVGAQVLVPMHWDLFPENRGFTSTLASYVAETFPELTLLIPGRGARFVYTPSRVTNA